MYIAHVLLCTEFEPNSFVTLQVKPTIPVRVSRLMLADFQGIIDRAGGTIGFGDPAVAILLVGKHPDNPPDK
jgi:hypothetical protein